LRGSPSSEVSSGPDPQRRASLPAGEQVIQQFTRFAQIALRERGCVRRVLRADVDRPRSAMDVSHKTGGGLDHAGSSNRHKESTAIQRLIDSIQLERHLSEPADVRTDLPAALASRYFIQRLVEIRVVKRRAAAAIATALEELSVHVNNVF